MRLSCTTFCIVGDVTSNSQILSWILSISFVFCSPSGLLSETSGDTAYASRSGETQLNGTLDLDDTNGPSDNGHDDEEMAVDSKEALQEFPAPESDGLVAPSCGISDQILHHVSADPKAGAGWRQSQEDVASTSNSLAVPRADSPGFPRATPSLPNPNPLAENGNFEEFTAVEENNNGIQRSGRRVPSGEDFLAELRDDVVREGGTVQVTSIAPQTLSNCPNDAVGEFHPVRTTLLPPAEHKPEEGSGPPSSDVSKLSRIIIQQLPKLFDLLKNENSSLRAQVSETEERLVSTRIELAEQKNVLLQLGPTIAASSKTEMELRSELDLKQRLIQELTSKIQIATQNYETLNQ